MKKCQLLLRCGVTIGWYDWAKSQEPPSTRVKLEKNNFNIVKI